MIKDGDRFVVLDNDRGVQRLYINESLTKQMLKDPNAKEFIGEKLRNAQWLIRAIEQRRKTIIRVTECIVEKQREFFEKGVAYLKPMILRDVAESVGMHESTISRVTTNKYVHTPQGLFELKYFFNSSIRRVADEDIASESVKQAIKKIIDEEDKANPLQRSGDRRDAREEGRHPDRTAHGREVSRDAWDPGVVEAQEAILEVARERTTPFRVATRHVTRAGYKEALHEYRDHVPSDGAQRRSQAVRP